jgi:hypothetical protein
MTDLTPNDLSHLSDAEFNSLCPQGEHAPGREPLSPAAQQVLDAYLRAPVDNRLSVAAALRAAVNQVLPHFDEPDWGSCNEMRCDIELYTDHQRKRAHFLAIAAELGGGNNPNQKD